MTIAKELAGITSGNRPMCVYRDDLGYRLQFPGNSVGNNKRNTMKLTATLELAVKHAARDYAHEQYLVRSKLRQKLLNEAEERAKKSHAAKLKRLIGEKKEIEGIRKGLIEREKRIDGQLYELDFDSYGSLRNDVSIYKKYGFVEPPEAQTAESLYASTILRLSVATDEEAKVILAEIGIKS